MTASPASVPVDRSDFRHVLVSGTKIGLTTAVAVALALAGSRLVAAGPARDAVITLIVLAGATAAGVLPGRWAAARSAEGVAGAAAIGLWGTVVFMAVDIVLFRPLKAYPWTWDAIGGGSTDAAFDLGPAGARRALAAVAGCGPWTVEFTMGFVLGDPDAVPTGDLHLAHEVGRALAGEERGDDARMLELLEPFRGHRFRVLRLLLAAGRVRLGRSSRP